MDINQIKGKGKGKGKGKARASKEKESQTGNPVMEKEEDAKAEDVASKEEEKAVVLVAVLERWWKVQSERRSQERCLPLLPEAWTL